MAASAQALPPLAPTDPAATGKPQRNSRMRPVTTLRIQSIYRIFYWYLS
jgi:hypothetical protein